MRRGWRSQGGANPWLRFCYRPKEGQIRNCLDGRNAKHGVSVVVYKQEATLNRCWERSLAGNRSELPFPSYSGFSLPQLCAIYQMGRVGRNRNLVPSTLHELTSCTQVPGGNKPHGTRGYRGFQDTPTRHSGRRERTHPGKGPPRPPTGKVLAATPGQTGGGGAELAGRLRKVAGLQAGGTVERER